MPARADAAIGAGMLGLWLKVDRDTTDTLTTVVEKAEETGKYEHQDNV